MNKSEILALFPYGPDIDDLIHEKIFGLCAHHWQKENPNKPDDRHGNSMYKCSKCGLRQPARDTRKASFYSSSIAPAWDVMKWMVRHGYCPALLYDGNGHWAVAVDGAQNVPMEDGSGDVWSSYFVEKELWCDTAPEAICRAALLVVSKDNTLSE